MAVERCSAWSKGYALLGMPLVLSLACSGPIGDSAERQSPQRSPDSCSILFEEVAAQAGLDFQHFSATRAALLPEDNGSGVAFGDYDNDGYDDLYIANLAGPVLLSRDQLRGTRQPGRLFHNQGNGTFVDVTRESGLEHVGWDNAVVWGDVDGDGWLDLILTGIDEVALFRNRGNGGDGRVPFEDTSLAAGLGSLNCMANGPSLSDFDHDGDLDLYVPCYVDFPWDRARQRPLVGGRPATMTTPADYPPQANRLFQNDGQGRFRDIAMEAGVVDAEGRGLQAVFVDLDDDGWPDLYVANDQSFDRLYRNQGDGTFVDVAPLAGTRDPRAGMGVAIGDFDLDGLLDLFLTHWVGEENALYRSFSAPGTILFEDRTFENGLAPVDSSWVAWGTGFFDFDLDGDLDLFVVNGSTIEDEWTLEVLTEPKMVPQPLRLYEQETAGFVDRSLCAGSVFGQNFVGRGASFADFDRDGRVDIAVSVHNGRPLLLKNSSATTGHWIGIQLAQQGHNRWAVGAKVVVHSGARTYVKQLLAGESYAGSSSTTLHFGLATDEITGVEVRWPDGEVTKTGPIPSDRVVRLRHEAQDWREVPLQPQDPQPWEG